MPSAFAHAWVGASLAMWLPRRARTPLVAAGLAALAAAPDLDVIGFRLGIPYAHPLGHRGITHSLFAAAALGALSVPLWRRVPGVRAGLGAVLVFAALASHGLLDTLTDDGLGIGLLLPFDEGRYFAPWRPLPTAGLSVSGFFSARGAGILARELLWLGLPVALGLGIVSWRRRRRARAPDVG